MSDLLTRATVARFNLDQLLRASATQRAEVYEKLVPIGVISAEEARRREGYEPGNVDYAPVPAAPPQAVPTLLPVNRTRGDLVELHCPKCRKLVGKVNGGAEIMCPRCGTMAVAA